jgi:hypothetical protein
MTELEILPPLPHEPTPARVTIEFIVRRPKPKPSIAVWPWLFLFLAVVAPHFALILLPLAVAIWLARA